MDYPLYYAIRDFAMTGQDDLVAFARRIQRWVLSAPEEIHPYQWAFCSNHDIPRLLTECGGDVERAKLALFLTAVLGGNMSVYYGDERGMEGGDDPDNRRAMVWGSCGTKLPDFYEGLIHIKKTLLHDARIVELSLREGLEIRMENSVGERLLTVIGRPGQPVTGFDNMKQAPIFGSVTLNKGLLSAHTFALFRED